MENRLMCQRRNSSAASAQKYSARLSPERDGGASSLVGSCGPGVGRGPGMMQTEARVASGLFSPPMQGRQHAPSYGPTAHGAAGRWGAEDTGKPWRLPKAKEEAACQTGRSISREWQGWLCHRALQGPLQKLEPVWSTTGGWWWEGVSQLGGQNPP